MAGKVGGDREELLAEINVTPFVDIALVLLIILMITSAEIVRSSLRVELPSAASGGEAVESTLNIVITKEGDTYLDGKKAGEAEIIERIRREAPLHPKLQAVIAADKGVVYGRVVHVIDLVKVNGVTSFALNIDREAARGE
jgi:biopolymer transport protein ExbD